MALALEYFLLSRMKDETGFAGPKYMMWQSLFPRGFAGVASKASKSSNLVLKSYDKILIDFADEWADDKDMSDFAEIANRIGLYARKAGGSGQEEARRLLNALSERHDVSDKLARAKRQLVDAVLVSLTRPSVEVTYTRRGTEFRENVDCVFAKIIEEGYLDPWSFDPVTGNENAGPKGLAFLFSVEFKEHFCDLLKKEFGWKDVQYFTKFASELETCQWTFMSGQLEDAQELEMMRSIVAMYVLAGLVGPGTFAGELGCSTEVVGTALETRMSRLNDDHAAKYQLQPIVFNGNGPWDYYTDTAGPLVFTAEEIVRFGRSDDSDPHWLEEYRGIAMTDRSVSRKHAQLEHTASGWYLTDVGSANGTIILRGHNGGRVFRKKGFTENERRVRVSTGDIFFFAPSGGHRYDARLKPMRIPNVEQHVVGKAFRFERIER